jgi:hypothetical protein
MWAEGNLSFLWKIQRPFSEYANQVGVNATLVGMSD